ncbi:MULTISPECIES: DNA (cytosine-5-)-methyltransferase [unclassified Mesorhizobium]|uniref:DNA (cytosine-5-)-methyltransferase n=1 Tax=unclassified Mesorhizobium TaxID=325217 RepID=UPI00112CC06D|nr:MULTISPECIES: DNA (cytosine-5-)-methyltransferase [unclassified Mesorhizobium]TPI51223.1 DNA (cytosine-5-)-methyltransferase [Mesorhizobium sp. B3-1-1]TPJ61363.1 DNA (cytosine-5-)-methyltransferase [Mesorhizobium sp. B2-6-7]TPJ78264.1 DNA (cytosine-5-)-methyltransferase [Mesorhizobium sp. B2-6-3]TPJ92572.1 DNA (cytosine-5-)-methyltransferase [Mesorhizobium sp. B2-5-10]TPK04474.1 DNA (cytosine-5-)-methyltransferase [Mesorhizobium sp. B2-5-11]
MSEFNDLLRQSGLTRDEAAEELGVSARTIRRYESGETQARPRDLRVLKGLIAAGARPLTKPMAVPFRFIDLFAGIGGLRIGFESIGGRCVFTSEWDQGARTTYSLNFRDNHELGGDIREYSKEPGKIPDHDVLLAGFPCQPFSIAGVSKKNSLNRPHGFLCDTQGTLFFDAAQIIAHHRPKAFVLENVKNLESHDGGTTFRTIVNVLRNELGYQVQHRVISSEPWVPQKRERIFIVGFREQSEFDFDALEVPNAKMGPKLNDILQPHEEVDPKYTLTPRLWQYLQDYRAKHQAKGNGFGYSLFGPNDVARTLSARYYKDGSEVLIEQPGKRPRRLTPLECARLMGFERDDRHWRIEVSDTQAYRQFGNAVVVPVVEFIAKAIEPHIRNAIGRTEQAARQPHIVPTITRPDRGAVAA